jgi:acid phosphatase (class A)
VSNKIQDIDITIQQKKVNNLKYTDNPKFLEVKYNLDWKNILEPPPLNDSLVVASELNYLSNLTSKISDNQQRLIKIVDKDPKYLFNDILSKKGLDFPEKIFDNYYDIFEKYILNVKYHFNRVRPEYLGDILNKKIHVIRSNTTRTPSYPSGHTCYAMLACILCSEMYPHLISDFRECVNITAYCREMQGVHYPSDNKASILFTKSIIDQLQKKLA